MTIEFQAWPKTPRLNRSAVYTEKIDGTNAAVIIEEFPFGTHREVPPNTKLVFGPDDDIDNAGYPTVEYLVAAQSRTRLITPGKNTDNYGFAGWVWDNAEELARTLGAGRHFGEWWGQGIQRRYDLDHKKFSLFNVNRWEDKLPPTPLVDAGILGTVPVLSRDNFGSDVVSNVLEHLSAFGSFAAPGFDKPEGIIVYHTQSKQNFKVLIENDEISKTEAGVR
jgi:hypothetical protein